MSCREFTSTEYDQILTSIIDIGGLLLKNGAEISRIEDTITRLAQAYGFHEINVFSITSSIVVTVERPDGRTVTQTRRVHDRYTDLGAVESLNALSRRLCEETHGPEELTAEVDALAAQIRERRNGGGAGRLLDWFVYAFVSASFAVFFGGDFIDGAAAALSGLFLCLVLKAGKSLRVNSLLMSLIGSAFTALAVVLLIRLGIGHHADKICIGNIMLVIPGVQLMTALRDMINGDTLAGTLNFLESVLKATAVAMGFAVVLITLGVPL